MELSLSFLLATAYDYKQAAIKINNESFNFLNSVENSGLLQNTDWVKEILIANNYRYFNAVIAYNEVTKMINEYRLI